MEHGRFLVVGRTLRNELETEKLRMQRIWAKREKQLDRAVTNTAGFYGDLSGIIGASLPQIEKLELPALDHSDADTSQTVDDVSSPDTSASNT